jgi:PDGLE domain
MRWFTIVALAIAIGLAAVASPFASPSPDGLERVAADNALAARAEQHDGPLLDYAAPGVDDARVATALAGFAGTLLVFTVGAGVAAVIRR